VTVYLLRRVGISVIVLIGISLFVFGLLHLIYPSPAIDVLGPKANAVSIAAWNRQHGFAAPVTVQYLHYIGNVLHGNFGFSYKLNQSVSSLFAERWLRSAYLVGSSLVLSVLIAVPLGIYQAARRNSPGDATMGAVSFVLYAMPDPFFYLILIDLLVFAVPVFGFEASQSNSIWSVIADWRGMTLPITGGALLLVAGYSRYMRSQAIDVLAQDFIKAARAKGLPERLVLARHLARNACLPMITLIGLSIPVLLAGNIFAEQIFNYPGLGLLFFNALGNEDYPVLLAYTLLGAILTVAGNFVADVALTAADPRIRLG
jgi:peptide/nickel transport system permease protein